MEIEPSAEVMVGVLHASVAVAVPAAGTPEGLQPRLDPGGQKVMVGSVISCTTMVRLQVEVLPQSSVAIQVRLVLDVPVQVPGVVTSMNVIATLASQASVAVGGLKTGVFGQLIGVVCATQVIVGGVSSTTVIV